MLEDLFIRPDLDNEKIIVTFTAPKNCRKVDYQVLDGDKVICRGEAAVDSGNGVVCFEQCIAGCKAWSVDAPFLYLLKLQLSGTNGSGDVEQTFGMTKIGVKDRQIYFNNQPFYMRGHIRGREAHDHPNLMGCSKAEYYEKNLRMAKAYGFNFVRFHSQVPEKEFLDAADRLGFLCQVEIRKYYGHYQRERESTNFDGDQELVNEADWGGMIHKLRNRPCVLIYCMGNEIDKPGRNERVRIISKLTKELDSTRLFLDTCSRGEYDRDTVDLDVQHMSYYAPFGKNYDMFDDSMHLSIYGSMSKKNMVEQDSPDNPTQITRREVPLKIPLIAHEACHYNVLRDPYELRKKFESYGTEEPWWVEETIKMIRAKGYEQQYSTMLEAATRFQYIWIKQCLESIRRSSILGGFHMLQFTDTDRYENANGLLDCFDDSKNIPPEKILPFNGPTVIVADLPRRSFREGENIRIPIHISHYSPEGFDLATLRWTLKSKDGDAVCISGSMDRFDLSKRCNRQLCRLDIRLPKVDKPEWLVFSCELEAEDKAHRVSNQWDIWLFPDRPDRVASVSADVQLGDLRLWKRYPWLCRSDDTSPGGKLLITDRFSKQVIEHLAEGKDVLVLYRIEENRTKHQHKEKYYLPSTWERFKGIIWDRGHNCGGFLREHAIIGDFPQDGFVDWQFYNLIEDSDKIDLDDFPVKIDPIVEGVDKAVRDRFDVGRFDLSEFQYAYTMRKFSYLFELRVGSGRLVVSGFNFKGIENDEPATCWMFENILNHMMSGRFEPQASISVDEFRDYLLNKGSAKRIKERMMTQYWQMDDAPLESKTYWKESEQWLREDG